MYRIHSNMTRRKVRDSFVAQHALLTRIRQYAKLPDLARPFQWYLCECSSIAWSYNKGCEASEHKSTTVTGFFFEQLI